MPALVQFPDQSLSVASSFLAHLFRKVSVACLSEVFLTSSGQTLPIWQSLICRCSRRHKRAAGRNRLPTQNTKYKHNEQELKKTTAQHNPILAVDFGPPQMGRSHIQPPSMFQHQPLLTRSGLWVLDFSDDHVRSQLCPPFLLTNF